MWEKQMSALTAWLSRPDHPVNLVLFYCEQPANTIRTFGPQSSQAEAATRKVDELVRLYLVSLPALLTVLC